MTRKAIQIVALQQPSCGAQAHARGIELGGTAADYMADLWEQLHAGTAKYHARRRARTFPAWVEAKEKIRDGLLKVGAHSRSSLCVRLYRAASILSIYACIHTYVHSYMHTYIYT